jgi:hypothetical protein
MKLGKRSLPISKKITFFLGKRSLPQTKKSYFFRANKRIKIGETGTSSLTALSFVDDNDGFYWDGTGVRQVTAGVDGVFMSDKRLQTNNGTANDPAIVGTELDTGIFFDTAECNVSTSGTERLSVTASGIDVTGTISTTVGLGKRSLPTFQKKITFFFRFTQWNHNP